jgi:hypothetical protein
MIRAGFRRAPVAGGLYAALFAPQRCRWPSVAALSGAYEFTAPRGR